MGIHKETTGAIVPGPHSSFGLENTVEYCLLCEGVNYANRTGHLVVHEPRKLRTLDWFGYTVWSVACKARTLPVAAVAG